MANARESIRSGTVQLLDESIYGCPYVFVFASAYVRTQATLLALLQDPYYTYVELPLHLHRRASGVAIYSNSGC